ncbi:MAG: hypothetical protein FJ222_01895 [Lentisphaerae bacterium]|nr:hypothetical protein [Lentisphaerota bacterium]
MRTPRASWMRQGKFGMMVHWLGDRTPQQYEHEITDHNEAVNQFDLERFIDGFRRSKADWLIFTIGQNTGCYASPNAVADRLIGPGHCSKRDLVLEIAREVKQLGRRFIAYIPSGVGGTPEAVQTGFDWKPEGVPMDEAQRRYTEFIAEYARRFGTLLDAWWFDGFYANHPAYFDLPRYSTLWLDAARAGNADCAVAFNDASFAASLTLPPVPDQDYLSGETWFLAQGKVLLQPGWKVSNEPMLLLTPATHPTQPPPNCLWHCLVPIDCMWETRIVFHECQNPPFAWVPPEPNQMERPLYSTDELESVVRDFKAVGGGVTFNVGIFQEGNLGPATVDRLAALAGRMEGRQPDPSQ